MTTWSSASIPVIGETKKELGKINNKQIVKSSLKDLEHKLYTSVGVPPKALKRDTVKDVYHRAMTEKRLRDMGVIK